MHQATPRVGACDPPVSQVRLWDLQTGDCKGVLGTTRDPGHLDGVTCFASAGNHLYSASRDYCIKHWSLGCAGAGAELLKTAPPARPKRLGA